MSLPASTLRRYVRDAGTAAAVSRERCHFCAELLPEEHRHLVEVDRREVECVCRPCSILFDREAASLGRYRTVPDRRLRLDGFAMSDETWRALRVPVGICFISHTTQAGRVVAAYPSPAGPVESALELTAWPQLVASNPVLATLTPDVEALLVNRARGARAHYLVPIDDCFRLVAIVRTGWRGLTGGSEVWASIERFFSALEARSRVVGGAPVMKQEARA
jgi:hypothetical protein